MKARTVIGWIALAFGALFLTYYRTTKGIAFGEEITFPFAKAASLTGSIAAWCTTAYLAISYWHWWKSKKWRTACEASSYVTVGLSFFLMVLGSPPIAHSSSHPILIKIFDPANAFLLFTMCLFASFIYFFCLNGMEECEKARQAIMKRSLELSPDVVLVSGI